MGLSTPAWGAVLVVAGVAFAVAFCIWALPRSTWKDGAGAPFRRAVSRGVHSWRWTLPAWGILALHMLMVNVIEPVMRPWWLALTGIDYTAMVVAVEDGLVASLSAIQSVPLTVAVAWFYLVFHHAMVLIMPVLLLGTGQVQLGRRYLLAIPITYLLAQPGFMFLPIDNPSVYYGIDPTPLEVAMPGVTALFYSGTTIDNTLPSMHIGLAFLAFFHGRESWLPRLRMYVAWYAPAVCFSIVYLQVHWFVDILGGIVIAWGGWWLARRLYGSPAVRRIFDDGAPSESA